jgi:hypothetical protein
MSPSATTKIEALKVPGANAAEFAAKLREVLEA